jgi:hypothetical protein
MCVRERNGKNGPMKETPSIRKAITFWTLSKIKIE